MKRKREIERKSEIKSAIEELSLLIRLRTTVKRSNSLHIKPQSPVSAGKNSDDNYLQQQHKLVLSHISTRPILSVCTLILQVLDKIGPTMTVMRQDIYKNIQRLEALCDSDPTKYINLVEILNKEAVEGIAKKGDSCSKAVLWLTRALDFTAALLKKLAVEPMENMEEIVGNSYETTLKPWHGWISAAAYKVALKLVPETETFISLLMDKGDNMDNLRDEIQVLHSLLTPLLEDLHSILSSYGLERLKST
ncbi:unnamed protein product [Amaranthus hypochondriacus]